MLMHSTCSAPRCLSLAISLLLLITAVRAADPPPASDVDKLVAQLQSDDAFLRLKAARSLGTLGPAAKPALPALQKLATDPDEDVRAVAAAAIARIQAPPPADAVTLKPLIDQLNDKDPLVRLKAAKALGDKGAAAQAAVDPLTRLLQDPDDDVRLIVAAALKKIGAKAESGEPGAADVEILRTASIFAKGYSDPAGLRTYPSRRYFLVIFRNKAQSPVRVNSLKVSWLDRSGAQTVDSETYPGGPDPILSGGQGALCFQLEATDAARKWKISVDSITALTLGDDELKECQENDLLRQKLKIVMARPLVEPTLQLHYGDTFTIRNPEKKLAKGIRLALLGYDDQAQLVRIMVYHINRAADGDTRLVMNPANFQEMEHFQKLAELEHLGDASKDVKIVKYEGEVLYVGARK